MAPKVSIVVPFYNAAPYLERSLGSACAQTEHDIELVCVDDGSTDAGAQVLARIAASDDRVRQVSLGHNQGRLAARLEGIRAAQGDFIMFLDADDELLHDAVEVALGLQGRPSADGVLQREDAAWRGAAGGKTCAAGGQQTAIGAQPHAPQVWQGFDIVQFNFDTRYVHPISATLRAFNDDFARPPAQEAYGDDVTHVVFRDRKTTWSLCGKLMRTSLVKQAAVWVEHNVDVSLQAAEDAYLFFLVASKARSYLGFPDYAGYVYNMDIGGSGAALDVMCIDEFQRDCQYAEAMDAIGRYVDECAPQLALDAEVVRYEHLLALSDKALHLVEEDQRSAAFCSLVDSWSPADAVGGIADAGWFEPVATWAAIASAPALRCAPRRIETAALLCDSAPADSAMPLSDGLACIQLHPTRDVRRDTYLVRARALAAALSKQQADVLLTGNYRDPLLAWDMLLAKACGVPVCVVVQERFVDLFAEGSVAISDCCRVLRYADALVVPSESDKRIWDQFNPQVWVAGVSWDRILDQLGQPASQRVGFDADDEYWDDLFAAQIAALETARNEGAREVEGSRTYRLGKALAKIPHLMRRLAQK